MNKLNIFAQFITSYCTLSLCNIESLLDITASFQIIIIYKKTIFKLSGILSIQNI